MDGANQHNAKAQKTFYSFLIMSTQINLVALCIKRTRNILVQV
jgi:hypothetical protein